MTIRVDVLPDGQIEIMRPHRITERNVYHKVEGVDKAMTLIRYYIQKDIEESEKNRFVSRQTIEARKAFKELEKQAPYHAKGKL